MDWSAFTQQPWESEPVRVPGGAVWLDPGTAYDVLRRAAAPYRHGSRFWALPEVRYRRPDGWIAMPGDLLPGEDEPLAGYVARAGNFVLTVREPFLLDYPCWSALRELVTPLWQRIGIPVVAVGTELGVGDGLGYDASAPDRWSLLWILSGELTVSTGIGGKGTGGDPADAVGALTGSAGDLISWPAGPATITATSAVWVRLLVPATAAGPAAQEVGDLLLTRLTALRNSTAVPYLPTSSAGRTMEPLAETADRFAAEATAEATERSLRVGWAKRVSAAALEPVPPPRRGDAGLTSGDRVRATAPVYRMPDGDQEVWAVNGHAFRIGGGAAVLAALAAGEVEVGDGPALAVLGRLHALRAVELSHG